MFNNKAIVYFQVYELDVVSEEIPRMLVLVSKGQVADPTSLFSFIESAAAEFSIFPFGFGQCNYFVVSIALLYYG